jgi:hypothetical protein
MSLSKHGGQASARVLRQAQDDSPLHVIPSRSSEYPDLNTQIANQLHDNSAFRQSHLVLLGVMPTITSSLATIGGSFSCSCGTSGTGNT